MAHGVTGRQAIRSALLRELGDAYPGGLGALALATGISSRQLYAMAAGTRSGAELAERQQALADELGVPLALLTMPEHEWRRQRKGA